jgi:tetratricopeptide (TPR) repeat protein
MRGEKRLDRGVERRFLGCDDSAENKKRDERQQESTHGELGLHAEWLRRTMTVTDGNTERNDAQAGIPCVPMAGAVKSLSFIAIRGPLASENMNEIIVCPSCKRRLNVHVDHMGKKVQCPTCETMFIAGAPNPPPPPEAVKAKAPAPAAQDQKRKREREDADMPPPRRSRRPAPVKATGGWKPWQTAMLILGAVAFLGAALIAVPILFVELGAGNRPARAPLVNFGPNNFPLVPPPPPTDVPDRILNAEEQQDHARAFFDHFGAVMRAPGDQAGPEMACFDSDRLLDTALEQKLIPAALQGERARLLNDFRMGLLQTSIYRGAQWWGEYEIKTIKQPRARELIVVTRHPERGSGLALRLRWWLAHRDGRWLVTEIEFIDYGVRLSTMLAGGLQPADPAVRTVRDAANVLLLRNDIDAADRILAPVRAADLPKACAVTHHVLTATIRHHQGRLEEMLTAGTAANRLDPDTPGSDYLCATALNKLTRWASAVKHARAAQAWLGDDPVICYELGFALHNQNQFADAAALYRKVLDVVPDNKEAFKDLLRCVGPGVNNDDIAARFLKMRNPENHFHEFAVDCWKGRQVSNVKALADAMLQRAPRHADAHFYLALVHAEQDRLGPALASFRTALQVQNFEPQREFYYTEFARTVVLRDQALPAYSGLPDRQRAFRTLGDAMKNMFRMDDLQDLIDAHVKFQPGDAYVPLFQGEIHLRDEQYKLADQAFGKAFAALNDPALEDRYRHSRIRARYQTGDILGAYRDIPPQRMAFQQLANSCWLDKKNADLKALVALHAENDPFDAQLPRFQWRVAIHDNRFAEAGKKLKSVLGQNFAPAQDRFLIDDFMRDMIAEGQALEGYRHAPDRHQALDTISAMLRHAYRDADLEAVLAEHRQAFPNDPVLVMHAGQEAVHKQDWAKAAATFRAGWRQLPDASRTSWSHSYLYAHFKAGQAVQAYQETGRRPENFRQLAGWLLSDKQIDAFERLVEEHRPLRANDAEFAAYDARLKILRGKAVQAADLMIGLLKDRPAHEQHRIGNPFLNQLANFDVAVEAYRCMPDKRDAFAQMVWKYHQSGRVKEFTRLIDEHAKEHADDPRLAVERAELLMLQGKFAAAAQQFALAKLKNPQDHFARLGYIRARVKLGKAADTYRELGPSQHGFLDIANQCLTLKDGMELERLLVAHRQAFPAAKNLAAWDVEAHWQKKDYAAAVKAIQADRAHLLKNQTWRWKCESYLVRGLVRLKKTEEAVQEAEAIGPRIETPQVLLALAVASSGDVPRFLKFLDTKKAQRYLVDDCYRDEDLGPLLRSEAFRAVQDRYPPPPIVPLPNGPFEADWD